MRTDDVGNASALEVIHGLNNRSDIKTNDDERSSSTLRSTEDLIGSLDNNCIEGLIVVAKGETAVVLRLTRFQLIPHSFL